MSDENTDNFAAQLKAIRDKIRVTKVVATRSVKGRTGDSFAGFSAGWQSVQDDFGGPGADAMATDEDDLAQASNGMTLKEAKAAYYIVAMTADIAALESAACNGSVSDAYFQETSKKIRANYSRLIQKVLGGTHGDKSDL